MAKDDYGEGGVREPEAGFWWAERRDGARHVVLVHGRAGEKSARTIGGNQTHPLPLFRREYRFLARVPEPESAGVAGRPDDGLWWVERADGRRSVVLVAQHFGRRCVRTAGSGSWTTLDAYAKTFRFLGPVPAPDAPAPTAGPSP